MGRSRKKLSGEPFELDIDVSKALALERKVLIIIGIDGGAAVCVWSSISTNHAKGHTHGELHIESKGAKTQRSHKCGGQDMLYLVAVSLTFHL